MASTSPELPDLRPLRPECYVEQPLLWSGESFLGYRVREPADLDWLESRLLDHGYYEHEGIWSLEADRDKQAMAEILSALAPRRSLELGCSSGAVLRGLVERGIDAWGVDISRMAIERAFPEIRHRIRHGDLLDLPLDGAFGLVYGLDIFEHLNPNRLPAYLARVAALLGDGGYVYAAIPAFADDPVFGLVFPLYVREWYGDVAAARPFRLLHVDGRGYPLNGHLVWADSHWWVEQFTAHGLVREPAIERAIHQRYDPLFDTYALARKAFYVFSKHGATPAREAVIDRVLSQGSVALGEPAGPAGTFLLRSPEVFGRGWHGLEVDAAGPYRWSRGRAELRLDGLAPGRLAFHVFTGHPAVKQAPVTVRFEDARAGRELTRVTLRSWEPVPLDLPVGGPELLVAVVVERPWVPAVSNAESSDTRELGIGVRHVRLSRDGEDSLPPPPRSLPARARARLRRWLGGGA